MIFKVIFGFLCIFGTLSFFSNHGKAQNPTTIIIPDISWEPYFFQAAPSPTRQGYAMEILQNCIDRQEIDIKRIPSAIKRTEHLLKHGGADLWVMSRRDGRDEWLDYSTEPLFEDGYAMFVRSDFNINVKDIKDLDNLRVGSVLGLHVTKPYQEWKARQPEHHKPLEVIHEQELLLKLINKKVDVAITSITPFLSYAKYHDVVKDIRISGKPLRVKSYYTVLSKEGKNIPKRKSFLRKLDQCIRELKKSSYIENLKMRYFSK